MAFLSLKTTILIKKTNNNLCHSQPSVEALQITNICDCITEHYIYFKLTGLLQVWNSNAVKDEFMGQVVLSGLVKDTSDPQRLQLRKSGRQMADEMPGNISLRIITSTQLTAI